MLWLLLFFVPLADAHRTGAYSWYSTIGQMRNLTSKDTKLLALLESRIRVQKLQLNKVDALIGQMLREGERLLKDFDERKEYTDFSLLSRYQKQWPGLERFSQFVLNEKVQVLFGSMFKLFPQSEDVEAALKALLQLQLYYGLRTADLAEGYVFGERVGRKLSTGSCMYMFTETCEIKKTKHCKDWGNIVIDRINAGEETGVDKEDIISGMQISHFEERFHDICNASLFRDSPGSSFNNNMKCYMWDNFRHPWLVLQPVPMEVVAYSPDVVVFHHVISDQDIEHIKTVAEAQLGMAETFERVKSVEVDSYRVTHNCWIPAANDSTIRRLDDLVSAITGLQVRKSSEQLQVANYGIGGHYRPHIDPMSYSEAKEIRLTNRKATFMYYLSDVEHGGATAFVDADVFVKPSKGSAVFWHNLLPSGFSDNRTWHGSCPVVLGDKWVANKWIWETKRDLCKPREYVGRIH